MNGIHDMGGMHGFAPLVPEPNETLSHAAWEMRTFGLTLLAGGPGKWNVDAFRQAIEQIPPADYLRMAYYDKWLTAITNLALAADLVNRDELATGRPAADTIRAEPKVTPATLPALFSTPAPRTRPVDAAPRFAPGARVRARMINPTTHTRLPRYLRGHAGAVTAHHGAHVFPDSNALFLGENPQHLYTVRFRARDLWGDGANPHDTLCADLWEPYLDHA